MFKISHCSLPVEHANVKFRYLGLPTATNPRSNIHMQNTVRFMDTFSDVVVYGRPSRYEPVQIPKNVGPIPPRQPPPRPEPSPLPPKPSVEVCGDVTTYLSNELDDLSLEVQQSTMDVDELRTQKIEIENLREALEIAKKQHEDLQSQLTAEQKEKEQILECKRLNLAKRKSDQDDDEVTFEVVTDQLRKIEESKKATEQELINMRKQFDAADQEVRRLQEELDRGKSDLGIVNVQYQQAKNTYDLNLEQLTKNNQQLAETLKGLEPQTEELVNLRAEHTKVIEDIKTKTALIVDYEKRRKELETQKEAVSQTLATERKKYQEAAAQVNALSEKIKKLEVELAQKNSTYETSKSALESQISELKTEVSNLENQSKAEAGRTKQNRTAKENLERDYGRSQEELKRVKDDLENTRKALKDQETLVATLTAENNRINGLFLDQAALTQQKAANIDELLEQNKALKEQIGTSGIENSELRNIIDANEARIRELEDEKQKAEQILQDLKAAKARVETQIASAKDQIIEKDQTIGLKTGLITTLTVKLANQEKEIQSQARKISKNKEEITKLKTSIESKESERQKLEEAKNDIERQRKKNDEKVKNQIAELDAELREVGEEKLKLQVDLDRQTEANKSLSVELADTKKTLNEYTTESVEDINRMKEVLKSFEQFVNLNELEKEQVASIVDIIGALNVSRVVLESAKTRIDDLISEVRQLTESKDELTRNTQTLRDAIEELKKENDTQKATIDEYIAFTTRLQEEITTLTGENEKMRAEIEVERQKMAQSLKDREAALIYDRTIDILSDEVQALGKRINSSTGKKILLSKPRVPMKR